ncbi:putative portal protein [Rhizobium phage RHph_Y1_1]|nr:putative portal protein [Rhizobium phage RHph_I36]QIG75377.1 putative portal protein [Rhizobium phage RHph_Y1_1]QIG75927.1 putative portal protein [Rhizobium phage RHph_Y2_17_2]
MGKVITFAKDALTSLVNGLGMIGKDKAASVVYTLPLWTDQHFSDMYRGAWLPRKIVNIPALDAMRKWRNWQTDEPKIELIEAEEKRLGVQAKLLEVMIKARLYGGAALYISTGEANTALPLDPADVKKGGIRFLNVLTKKQLNAGDLVEDPESEYFNKPEFYTLARNPSVIIHASRLVIFTGERLPDPELVATSAMGWGDSVLLSCLEAIKSVDSTAANIVSLIFEAKIDVVKIPGLMDSLSDPTSESRLLTRFQLANVAKGNNAMLLLDSEEEYEQKNASFATLPDILQLLITMAAGAADIPVTRLLGQSPAGMNSTGESDLRNYYDRIASIQTLEIDPAINILNECLIRSATGARDAAIHYIWASLWQTTDKERAEIGKTNADTINTLYSTNLFPPEALANAAMNMLVENSIMPGLIEEVESVGGLPDYEAELEKQQAAEIAAAQAKSAPRVAANDATPKTLYVRRDVTNAGDIRDWAKAQGFTTVQRDLHVTIIHTRSLVDWIKVGQDAEWADGKGSMTINAGGPRLMEQFGDAVVLQFASNRLAWRHEDMKRLGAETDFPDFQPHITITWDKPEGMDLRKVEPYRGIIELGPEIFEEVDDNWRAGIAEDEV